MLKNPVPVDDTWAFQPIGDPFPEDPVKVIGQQNMYVALWYKHGKPIHGRAWNNGGVVECSFPYNNMELTGKTELGDHRNLGYWYNWIKYSERFDKTDQRQLLKCGDSWPILWSNRPDGPLLGYLDNKTEIAYFSHDKIAEQITGPELSDMLIIVRELDGGPPACECMECAKAPAPVIRVMSHHWADFRAGDPWPKHKMVRAMNKSLNTVAGENPDQYVALWYQSGEPVMGRVWNENGKIAASFSWGGIEYRDRIGSLQILLEMPAKLRGFDYDWKPYSEAVKAAGEEWHPVYINHQSGNIAPGVLKIDNKEILGQVDIRNERATVGIDNAEKVLVGEDVHSSMILCRRRTKPEIPFEFKFDLDFLCIFLILLVTYLCLGRGKL